MGASHQKGCSCGVSFKDGCFSGVQVMPEAGYWGGELWSAARTCSWMT